MSTLEDRIRRDLHRAVLERPKALEALSTGDSVHGDVSALIRDVMLPMLMAQGDALIEAAREIDDLHRRLADLEAEPRSTPDGPDTNIS